MSEEKFGWEKYAEKHFCPRDAWDEGIGAIKGTWNEKEGSWYEYVYRCSNCHHKNYHDSKTPFCPYCGKPMTFVERIVREDMPK